MEQSKQPFDDGKRLSTVRQTESSYTSEIIQYLQDVNLAEALVIGSGDLMTASNKESVMKAYIGAWNVHYEKLVEKQRSK